jgi:hypothetical protein
MNSQTRPILPLLQLLQLLLLLLLQQLRHFPIKDILSIGT